LLKVEENLSNFHVQKEYGAVVSAILW